MIPRVPVSPCLRVAAALLATLPAALLAAAQQPTPADYDLPAATVGQSPSAADYGLPTTDGGTTKGTNDTNTDGNPKVCDPPRSKPTTTPRAVPPPARPQPQRAAAYPVHPGMRWNVNGNWQPSRAELIRHLTEDGMHRGRFNRVWLQGLTRAELISLHDDHHDGRVRFGQTQRATSANCPNGRCPK